MTVTTDDKRRIPLRMASPGQRWDVQETGDGRVVLTPLVPLVEPNKALPEPKRVTAKLVRRGKHLVFEAQGLQMDPEAIARAVQEERQSR